MTDEVAELRAENEKLSEAIAGLTADREHYRDLYQKALEQCRKLELGILGPKKERVDIGDGQLTLAVLETLLGRAPTLEPPIPPKQIIAEHTRAKPTGRKPLPDHLPRVDIELVPPEVEQQGREAFVQIGEDVSETIERRPASIVIVRVHKPKFVRKDRERMAETDVLVAASPELPIERGLAGPGLLAATIVQRWQDHLPLNRLESIYAREGVPLARSTMCGWHESLSALCRTLIEAMWADARGAPYLCTDATGVLVQARKECRRGHFWVVVAPERHVLYVYTPDHTSAAVDGFLGDYEGYLVADAHAVYDHLYKTGKVVECACWAHARRYFYKSLESEPVLARQPLTLISELFRIERTLKDARPDQRLTVRQRETKLVVDKFFAWCDAQADHVLDDTPIAKGIGYARNQRDALSRFLGDGRLPAHNNSSERALRREVLGRKNWLFVGNDAAAEINTTFVTLLASCQLHGIEPWSYLRDLFCLLPSWPARRVLELAPLHWKKTCEQDDTQQRLAANIFRRAVIQLDSHHDSK